MELSKGAPKNDWQVQQYYTRRYFSPFGAGGSANDVLEQQFDTQMDVLWDKILKNPANSPRSETNKYPANIIELMKTLDQDYTNVWDLTGKRRDSIADMSPQVDRANKLGIITGSATGLLGAGAIYAGLGLIPKLKQRRLLRALAAINSGIGIGLFTADRTSKYVFKKGMA